MVKEVTYKGFDEVINKIEEYLKLYHKSNAKERNYLKYIFKDELNKFIYDRKINSYFLTPVRESKNVEYEIRIMPIEAVSYLEAILFTDGTINFREIAPYEGV